MPRVIVVSHLLPYAFTLEGISGIVGQFENIPATNVNGIPVNDTTAAAVDNGVASTDPAAKPSENTSTSNSDCNLSYSRDLFISSEKMNNQKNRKQMAVSQKLERLGTNFILLPRMGNSALFAGMKSISSSYEVIYVGWCGNIVDERGLSIPMEGLALHSETQKNALTAKLWSEQCIPIFLSQEDARGFYDGYCKSNLWPLFHYILWEVATDGREDSKNWLHYKSVNESFAKKICEVYEPGDLIWIHDYHLMLTPEMLRKQNPDAAIGFFLHSPFPSSEIFRCIPRRKEILTGLLGCNLLGFQTYSYARHFISSCTRVLGLESSPKGVEHKGYQVGIGIFPIGVNVKMLERKRKTNAVLKKMRIIRDLYGDRKIIIGRDRLDQIKGVEHKLLAFKKFLTEYPEWRNRVVLVQLTTPGRQVSRNNSSSKIESKVSELISSINGEYGSLEFVPIHHFHQHIQNDDYYALLSLADVGMITSVRDGMNMTSHEFIVAQSENHAPLILSEFTGTAHSLGAALLINPWDYSGVSHALLEGLTMSKEEKRARHEQLLEHVYSNTAEVWALSFINDLKASLLIPDQANPTPPLDFDHICGLYRNSSRRMIFLDYDGTLTAIRKVPNAAVPSSSLLTALEALSNDPRNLLFVISGRDQVALENWLGKIGKLGLSAEHGCFIRYPDSLSWINLSNEIDLQWKNDVLPIFEYYTERTPGSFIEHKRASLTWHYRLSDPEFGSWQAKECQNHLENAILSKLPVEILVGKKNLEVRPVSINKGEIIKRLVANRQIAQEFIFCAGDDKTDEDMFRVLKKMEGERIVTCTVGSAKKMTLAHYHVPSPEDVIRLLTLFSKEK